MELGLGALKLSPADVLLCLFGLIRRLTMETATIYWGYIGIMEKKMETIGIIGII